MLFLMAGVPSFAADLSAIRLAPRPSKQTPSGVAVQNLGFRFISCKNTRELRCMAKGFGRQGNFRAAFRLAAFKRAAIFRAVLLSPTEATVSIDRRATSPLLSIKFNGAGALHLPLRGKHGSNLIILGFSLSGK